MNDTRRYPTSPPPEDRDAPRRTEDGQAVSGRPEDDGGYAGAPSEPDARGYGNQNSGRRGAGHGGGSLDASQDGADYEVEPDSDFSGGGRGHAAQASQQREADEEMEGRTGPYIRSGLAGRDERNRDSAKEISEGTGPGSSAPGSRNSPSEDPDSGPPRTGGPRR